MAHIHSEEDDHLHLAGSSGNKNNHSIIEETDATNNTTLSNPEG